MVTASVIIVSHGRPDALLRAIDGVAQLDAYGFELVVVADHGGAKAVMARPDADRIKLRQFDTPNISAARNIGIATSAGEVVAFVDDDAVPEPTWLDRLIAPFDDPEVSASGGFVLGRNGISYQWRGSSCDAAGRSYPREVDAPLPPGHRWRTEGTCMAFRRQSLVEIGGFDEALHFFLDETDVNRRLAGRTVVVPGAVVHHGFAASVRRRQDRVPTTLIEIGTSAAHFLTKHAPDERTKRLDEMRAEQHARLLRHMVAGRIEPRDVRRINASFDKGVSMAQHREINHGLGTDTPPTFVAFLTKPPGDKVLITGRVRDKDSLVREAHQYLQDGLRPSLFCLTRGARYWNVKFERPGIWTHQGGQFGRSNRGDSPVQLESFQARINREMARLADVRGQLLLHSTCKS